MYFYGQKIFLSLGIKFCYSRKNFLHGNVHYKTKQTGFKRKILTLDCLKNIFIRRHRENVFHFVVEFIYYIHRHGFLFQ